MSALSAQAVAIISRVVTTLTPSGVPHHAATFLLALAAVYGGMRILRRFRNGPTHDRVFSTQQQTVITLYTTMLQCCAQRGSPNQPAPRHSSFLIRFKRDGARPGPLPML